jgi:hypothetical protein
MTKWRSSYLVTSHPRLTDAAQDGRFGSVADAMAEAVRLRLRQITLDQPEPALAGQNPGQCL